MNENDYELIVVGGGPAGLAAALSAKERGLSRILIVERDKELGGILNQCIHNGFGLHHFGEELTGPEYAGRFIDRLATAGIDLALDSMALRIEAQANERRVHLMSAREGYRVLRCRAIILAMGCRERSRGAIQLPGTRPAGVFTAGTAQRYVNIEGWAVGKRVIILGSGDIGLIMARRLRLEGAEVLACVELLPFSSGLNRNIVQCLHDYNIPLYLSHTITRIEGRERVSRVTVQQVNEQLKPIAGTERYYDVDTVLLSVGLIPENELSAEAGVRMDPRTSGAYVFENTETSLPGVFACGNVLHVHDLVDFVTEESQRAGVAAARYVLDAAQDVSGGKTLSLLPDASVAYTVPQQIRVENVDKTLRIFFRVKKIWNKEARVVFRDGDKTIASFKREFMVPGEMQNVSLPKALLAKTQGETLRVSVEEIEA